MMSKVAKYCSVVISIATIISVLVAAFSSCRKNDQEVASHGTVTVCASQEASKVLLKKGETVKFVKKDRLIGFDTDGNRYISNESGRQYESVDFTFDDWSGTAPAYFAFNSKTTTKVNDAARISGDDIELTVPYKQEIYDTNSFARYGPVLVGKAVVDNGSCSSMLKNICGYVRVAFDNYDCIHKVTLKSQEGTPVSGLIHVSKSSVDSGEPEAVTVDGKGIDSVFITPIKSGNARGIGTDGNECFKMKDDGVFYFSVLPGTFTPVITFTDTLGRTSTKIATKQITVTRAGIFDLKTVDANLDFEHPKAVTTWEKQVLKRADLLYNVQWTPLRNISTAHKDEYFTAGTTFTGIPYSSVWSKSPAGFVGYTTSFYTFLSALDNPKGIIYDIDYHYTAAGENEDHAGCMYGTVCSTTVMYILGYPNGYTTSQIVAGYVPALTDLGTDFSDLRLCDAFCYNDPADGNGHTLMIYDLERDSSGDVTSVTVEEGWMPLVRRKTYTKDALISRLNKEGEGLYHHFRVDQSKFCYNQPSYVEQSSSFCYDFPSEICLSEGDRRSCLDTAKVTVNILTDKYPEVVLEKDGVILQTRDYAGEDTMVFTSLESGLYRAYLKNGNDLSAATSFEIVGNLALSASLVSDEIRVSIPDGFTPIAIVPVSSGNRPLLSTGKAKDGRWAFPIPEGAGASSWGSYITVKLAGQYNMITYPTKIKYK